MTATTTTISQLLKDQYEGPIREQLNLEAMIYGLFEEGPHQWAGANVHVPLHTRGIVTTAAAGIQYGSEGAGGAVVPEASNQQYLEMIVGYQSLYCAFEVTGQAEAQAPGNGGSEAAFIGAMYSEMRAMEKDVRHKLDRDMFIGRGLPGFVIDQDQHLAAGTGNTCMISGANTLAAIVAENTAALLNTYVKVLHVPRVDTTNWAYLPDGNAAPTAAALFQVGAIDQVTGSAVLDSTTHAGDGPDTRTVGATDLAVLVEHTVAGARVRTDEVHGLNSLAFEAESAGAFTNSRLGVTNTVLRGFGYKSAVAVAPAVGSGNSNGVALDLEDMQLVYDGIEDLTAERIDCLIMHRFTRAQYKNLFQADQRWLPGETDARGGFSAEDLAFEGNIPIKVSSQAPYGVIYFIRKDTINTYTLRPGGFQEFNDNGDIVTQKRDLGTARLMDVREGFWKQYFELVSEKPRCIGVMAGVRYKRA
tara:strand:+ start:42 stop:1463 length:1422 start_codon:yes stop_codon:yes gene_type:complete